MHIRPLLFAALLAVSLGPTVHAQTAKHTIRASRGGYYEATSTYLMLTDGSPLAPLVNRTLADWVQAQQRAFVRQTRRELDHQRPAHLYDYQVDPCYHHYLFPRLFSVCLQQYQFTGGAHGYAGRTTFNFALIDGKPKRLRLADFFTPGSNYRKLVQDALLAKLHKNPRAEFINEVQALTPAQLNRFVVEADGLRFLFDQYEVGSYAAGQIDVKLTLPELGPDFKRSLLFAR